MFGPLSTKSALSDPDIRARIMKAGEKYHSLLCKTPDIPSFLKYSRMFAEETALYSDKVRAALDTFTATGINASMPMFGEGIFSILHKQGMACSILCLGILPIIEHVMNVPTQSRLAELSDLNTPILQKMLHMASGTFNHSILVGNLAEAAWHLLGAVYLEKAYAPEVLYQVAADLIHPLA